MTEWITFADPIAVLNFAVGDQLMDGSVVVAVDLMRGRIGVRAPSFWLRAWFWLRTRAKALWFGLRCWAAYLLERLR